MNLGLAALYIAFGPVALWLLGEVLLQHRAPAPWRALALGGFLGVAGGVALGSIPLICAGAVGFGAGQAMVTRAVKRADAVFWSLRRADGTVPGPLGRLPFLRAAAEPPPAADEPVEPVGEVGPVEEVPVPTVAAAAFEEAPTQSWDGGGYAYQEQQPEPAIYQMRPLDEDSDNYGVYTGAAAEQVREQYAAAYGYQDYGQQQYQQQPYEYQQQPAYAEYGQYQEQQYYDPYGQQQYDYQPQQQPSYEHQDPYQQPYPPQEQHY